MTHYPPPPHGQPYPPQGYPPPGWTPPQPPKKRKWPWIVGGIFGFFVLVGACNGGSNSSSTSSTVSTAASASRPAAVPTVPAVAAAPESAGTAPTDFKAGETATTEDGMSITAAPFTRQRFLGETILCSMVTYKNGSGEKESFNGLFDWEVQTPSGVIRNPSLGGKDSLSAGELAPGGTVKGNVCFENPGESGDYWIITKVSFWTGEELRWKVTV